MAYEGHLQVYDHSLINNGEQSLDKSISIEANELLKCFQWSDTNYDIEHVRLHPEFLTESVRKAVCSRS